MFVPTPRRIRAALRLRRRRLQGWRRTTFDRPAYWRWRRYAANAAVSWLRLRAAVAHAAGRPPPDLPAPPARLLFVAGCSRSGTTWVQDLLGEHPLTVTEQESHVYAQLVEPLEAAGTTIAGFGQVLFNADYGRRRGENVGIHCWVSRRELHRLVLAAMHRADWSPTEVAEFLVAALLGTLFAARQVTADDVLVEKSPEHLLEAERILRRFPQAKMIELVRDGRDVAVSKYQRTMGNRGESRRWQSDDVRGLATRWSRYVRHGQSLRADPEFAGRVLLVHYEDLKADTAQETARMLAFAGLDGGDDLAARLAEKTVFGSYGATGFGSHRRKGIVGDWRNYFTDDEVDVFREVAGDALVAAGYEA